ncbi:MAG: hypothetical protein CFE37_12530 [Alphaproteobacteria bacterium PA4]|nr:MAG: hypothetical protein CFE37_12530 [Alphaproteobacteria bacterium PA4]
MHMCFDCLLKERPHWLERYMLGWYLLAVYAGVAFLLLDGQRGQDAQGLFFLILFPWIVWPIVAAIRPKKPR